MRVKKERPGGNQGQSVDHDKCTENRVKWQIRKLFREGGKYTAKQLNEITGGNDARKVISDIRNKDNWNIKDVWLDTGCKLYWLEPDNQPTLFGKEAFNG
ncbi:AbrB family transcriptional regulator [Alistipes indistinctus]|uniref:AbrB family transcriptional regulator n=1 Tax=Alistipes indistinctus TaxID=626932 RepID=UPI00241EF5DB|nr:AbrB family transcriptional regulator [Alistipes indistinctus]